MFSKVLIANRGEIACRVIRTCQRMGVKTVAVYSSVDAGSLPVRQADEAVPLGPAAPQESYLNAGKILAAAQLAGADAIHPGYGFLSENPRFARQCEEAGITFIGPRPEVMEQMGDKLLARNIAREEGLPMLPGTDDAVPDDEAAETAWRLGFPLMVKAAEGGGGIGIHIVRSPEELAPLIDRSRQAASGAFGSGRLYFERYLQDASHIEVQLMGDNYGNIVHLFEARLLGATAQPEAHRGNPGLRQTQARYSPPPGVSGSHPGAAHRLQQRRHRGVPGIPRRQRLLPGDEYAATSGAWRNRDDYRPGLGGIAASRCRRRAPAHNPG